MRLYKVNHNGLAISCREITKHTPKYLFYKEKIDGPEVREKKLQESCTWLTTLDQAKRFAMEYAQRRQNHHSEMLVEWGVKIRQIELLSHDMVQIKKPK